MPRVASARCYTGSKIENQRNDVWGAVFSTASLRGARL
jgi:hypothetical protein